MAFKIDDQGKKALKIVGAIVLIATILFFVGCSYFNEQMDLPNDNEAEQILEEVLDAVVETQIGIDPEIDLTPGENNANDPQE